MSTPRFAMEQRRYERKVPDMGKGAGRNRYLRRTGGAQGAPAGGGNPLMAAQELLAKAQQELAEATVEGSAGGGAVRVTMSGDQKIRGIKIDPEVANPDDVELLEELIMAAIADATSRAAQLQEQSFAAIAGSLKLPGLGSGP